MGTRHTRPTTRARVALAALAVLAAGCDDTFTPAPRTILDGRVALSDSVFTRGTVVRAHVAVPAGWELEHGSVRWTVDAALASVTEVAGTADSVDVRFTGAGAADLQATWTARRRSSEGGSGVTSPAVTGVQLAQGVAARRLTIAQPAIALASAPAASVEAGATLAAVRVELRDARGEAIAGATDSVVLALTDAGGATVPLVGTTRARAAAGVATFADLAVLRAGAGYRLVATSPTVPGSAGATFAVTAGAPSAAQSTLTLARTTLPAGDTTTVAVVVRDVFGNVVTGATAAAFAGAATRGTLGAFTCTAGGCTATYTAPATTGAATVSASVAGAAIPGSPVAVTVVAGPAARLAITGDTSYVAGEPGTVTITALDAFGNVAAGYTGAHALVFSGAAAAPAGQLPRVGGVAFGSATTLTFDAGVATAPLSVVRVERALVAAAAGTLVAAGADRLPAVIAASAPSPAHTTMLVDTTTVSSGGVTMVRVTVRDSLGNVVTTATPAAVSVTPSGGTLGTFTCAAGTCSAPLTVPATAGAVTLQVTVGGTPLPGAPTTIAVTAGPATRLAITGASSQVAGTAQAITLTAYDAAGNVATGYTGAKSLAFSGALASPAGSAPTAAGVAFGSATGVTFTDGVATAALRLGRVEVAQVAATDGTIAAAGSDRLAVTVGAGAPDAARSTLELGRTALASGDTTTVTVTVRDAEGNVVPGATPALIAGSTTLGTLGAFACTAGRCTATYTATVAGAASIATSIGGGATGGSPATVAVSAGPATELLLVTPAAGATSGAAFVTQPVLELRDAHGNRAGSSAAVTLTVSAGGTTVGTTTVSAVAGLATFATAGIAGPIGSYTLTFAAAGIPAATQPVALGAGAAARLAITGSATQVAGSTQAITLTAYDAAGNVATGYAGAVSLTFSGAGSSPAGNAPTVAAVAFGTTTSTSFTSGVATAVLRLRAAEVAQVAATDGTIAAAGADRLQVTVTAGSASAARSTLSVGRTALGAGDTTHVTMTVRDADGNPVPGTTGATFASSASVGTLGAWGCSGGTCAAVYTATAVGTATIGATVGGTPVGGSPASVTVSPGAPAQLAIGTSAATATSGAPFGTQPVIEVRDAAGYRTSSTIAVTLTASSGGTVIGTATVNAVNGYASFSGVGLSGLAGAYTLSYGAPGVTSVTQPISLTAGSATRFEVTGSATQVAGTSQTMTITARDAAGNVATSYTGPRWLTFSGASTAPQGQVPSAFGTPFGASTSRTFTAGVSTAPVILYAAEVATIAVTDGSVSAAGDDRLPVAVSAGSPSAARTTLAMSGSSVSTNGTLVATVTVRDAYGNAVTTATAADFVAGADAGTLDPFTCTLGSCTATYTAPALPTTETVDVRIGGTPVGGSPATVNVLGSGPYLTASAQGTIAVNEVSERLIFYVTEGGARTAVTQPTTFSLASTGTGATFYSDNDGTATITSATVPAGADSLVVYYRQAGGAGSTATLSVTQVAGDAVAAGTVPLAVTATTAAAARLAGEVCSATSSNSVTASLTTASGTTCTVQAGQLVFMVFGHDADNSQALPTIADPAGWTLLRSTDAGVPGNANQLRVKVYYRVAAATGSVTPTFSTSAGTVKVRMTFSIIALDAPNAIPFGPSDVRAGATVPGGRIDLPGVHAAEDASSLLAWAVQNIGGTGFVAPAGLQTVAQAGQGGQAITMVLFSKDRVFAGQTPLYSVTTAQAGNSYVGGQVIVNP